MRNRTWNQHCKGEGGRAEEENLIFFKSFGKDCSSICLSLLALINFTIQALASCPWRVLESALLSVCCSA